MKPWSNAWNDARIFIWSNPELHVWLAVQTQTSVLIDVRESIQGHVVSDVWTNVGSIVRGYIRGRE